MLAYEANFYSSYLVFSLTENSKTELVVLTLKSVNRKWVYLREAFFQSFFPV